MYLWAKKSKKQHNNAGVPALLCRFFWYDLPCLNQVLERGIGITIELTQRS